MNYELAKKLKDAGFPQYMTYGYLCFYEGKEYIHTGGGHLPAGSGTEGFYYDKGQTCCNDDDNLHFKNIDNSLIVKIPSLSELIEACTGNFIRLLSPFFSDEPIDITKKHHWQADGSFIKLTGKGDACGLGDTPEEAVANLWLEINKFKNV